MSISEDMLRRMQADDMRLRQTETKEVPASGGGGGLGLVARYRNTTGKIVADSVTSVINFDTADLSNAAVTTGASWNFTAPATVWYDVRIVQAFVNSDSHAWVVGSGVFIDIFVNGVGIGTLGIADAQATTSSIDLPVSGTSAVDLTIGDVLDLRFRNTSGNSRELEGDCAIEIYQVT